MKEEKEPLDKNTHQIVFKEEPTEKENIENKKDEENQRKKII